MIQPLSPTLVKILIPLGLAMLVSIAATCQATQQQERYNPSIFHMNNSSDSDQQREIKLIENFYFYNI